MSASSTVLSFSYAAPKRVPAINNALPKDGQLAQLQIENAISGATLELLRAGYDRVEADHLSRICIAHLAQACYPANLPAKWLLIAWADRMDREGWKKATTDTTRRHP